MNKLFAPLLKEMKEINPKGLIVNSAFDDCIIGIGENYQGTLLIYSENKVVAELKKKMLDEEARDYFDTAILSESYGEHTPIFLVNISPDVEL